MLFTNIIIIMFFLIIILPQNHGVVVAPNASPAGARGYLFYGGVWITTITRI